MMELNYLQNQFKELNKENYKISDFHDLILSDGIKQDKIEKKFKLVFAGPGLRETIKFYKKKNEFLIINNIYQAN